MFGWHSETTPPKKQKFVHFKVVGLEAILLPRGHLGGFGEMFRVSQLEQVGCSWHLMGGAWGCCQTPSSAQDAPQERTMSIRVTLVTTCEPPPPAPPYSINPEFPGGPVVRNYTFTAEDLGLISVRELRSHKPRDASKKQGGGGRIMISSCPTQEVHWIENSAPHRPGAVTSGRHPW